MTDPFTAVATELNMLRSTFPQMQHMLHVLEQENTSLKMERGAYLHELHLKNQDCVVVAKLRAEVAELKKLLHVPECVSVGTQFTSTACVGENSTQTSIVEMRAMSVQTCETPCCDIEVQTIATKTKPVATQTLVTSAEVGSQTDALSCPEPYVPPEENVVNGHAWLQKLWLLCTTVIPNLKPGRPSFIQNCALILRCWYVYTPALFVAGERMSDIAYQCVDEHIFNIVRKAPAHSFVLSRQPYKRWPPNNDELRKSTMRLVRSVYAQLSNVMMAKFIPHLIPFLKSDMGFKSAEAVKVLPTPNVVRVVHAEASTVMEYVLPMSAAVGVLLTLPNGNKWTLSFASLIQHAKENVVGEAVTMVDLGQTERLLNSSDCTPVTDTELAVFFTNHLTNAQNLLGVKAEDIVSALRPALQYTFDTMHFLNGFTLAERDGLISKMLTWSKKLVRAASKDARLSRSDMLCLPL